MNLIIGLGNPEKKYQDNRHNVGFMIADAIIQSQNSRLQSPGAIATGGQAKLKTQKYNPKLKSEIAEFKNIVIAKPQTFMNSSGEAVSNIVRQYKLKLPDIWVIHDDLDIPLGQYKIQLGKGPKVHNGLLSIYEKLGTRNFWHVRVGVDNRHGEISKSLAASEAVAESISRDPMRGVKRSLIGGKKYVLEDFSREEMQILDKVIANILADLRSRLLHCYIVMRNQNDS